MAWNTKVPHSPVILGLDPRIHLSQQIWTLGSGAEGDVIGNGEMSEGDARIGACYITHHAALCLYDGVETSWDDLHRCDV